ncbi:type III-A CRISPR-associated RAMP protein Csm5 [Arcicella sp. LKC2W]|uniref:type III-A CRISPR-associated RAMP protein Csm5 n=1 Tax=Arcicella sp. LKC2W TaxID=2984198 RepID=UPI002B20074F|nr:type III-A CRISPR-associated RAMP protein Csm5 [Arcicella sp. LKC2W]MEA5461607.1 type III-A CRISPR-associated RAMP protein Csm5 [Arcicella sp. LKC2W]
MKDIDKSTITNTFEVEILTPTHIGGAGENHWQKGIDFIAKDSKTWILDFNKLCKVIPVDKITLAFTRADRNITIESLIGNLNIESVSNKNFNFPNPSGSELKRHIFNGMNGKPYIPGSSIKGAIASVLMNHFSKKTDFEKFRDPNTKLLGGADNSIMRYFQFTDVCFEGTVLKNTKIFNLHNNSGDWIGGWKHNRETNQNFNSEFTTTYESLAPKDKSTMMLSFKMKAIEQLYFSQNKTPEKNIPPSHTKSWLINKPMAELCSIINKHTLSFLDKEIKFYLKYKFDDNSESAYEELLKLKEEANNLDSSKSCILRLAAGSGFHSITGDWQYEDYVNTGVHGNGKRKYKSRKLAFQTDSKGSRVFQPMGFIKLTLLDEETKLKRQQAETLKKERDAQDAVEKVRAEAERLENQRIAKEEAKKPKMYDGLPTKNLEVDAEVIESGKPNKVKIFVKGYEEKKFEMVDSASQPKGFICRVSLVMEKGRIVRVSFKVPK